ncbi:unnamed protein product [Amoebophrya sp. A120]|nr:unnamed protein product [Amoebophrya sp. A120]|eukprot:GSA120T00016979001.1
MNITRPDKNNMKNAGEELDLFYQNDFYEEDTGEKNGADNPTQTQRDEDVQANRFEIGTPAPSARVDRTSDDVQRDHYTPGSYLQMSANSVATSSAEYFSIASARGEGTQGLPVESFDLSSSRTNKAAEVQARQKAAFFQAFGAKADDDDGGEVDETAKKSFSAKGQGLIVDNNLFQAAEPDIEMGVFTPTSASHNNHQAGNPSTARPRDPWHGWRVGTQDSRLFFYKKDFRQYEMPTVMESRVFGKWRLVYPNDGTKPFYYNRKLNLSLPNHPVNTLNVFDACFKGDLFYLHLFLDAFWLELSQGVYDIVDDTTGGEGSRFGAASSSSSSIELSGADETTTQEQKDSEQPVTSKKATKSSRTRSAVVQSLATIAEEAAAVEEVRKRKMDKLQRLAEKLQIGAAAPVGPFPAVGGGKRPVLFFEGEHAMTPGGNNNGSDVSTPSGRTPKSPLYRGDRLITSGFSLTQQDSKNSSVAGGPTASVLSGAGGARTPLVPGSPTRAAGAAATVGEKPGTNMTTPAPEMKPKMTVDKAAAIMKKAATLVPKLSLTPPGKDVKNAQPASGGKMMMQHLPQEGLAKAKQSGLATATALLAKIKQGQASSSSPAGAASPKSLLQTGPVVLGVPSLRGTTLASSPLVGGSSRGGAAAGVSNFSPVAQLQRPRVVEPKEMSVSVQTPRLARGAVNEEEDSESNASSREGAVVAGASLGAGKNVVAPSSRVLAPESKTSAVDEEVELFVGAKEILVTESPSPSESPSPPLTARFPASTPPLTSRVQPGASTSPPLTARMLVPASSTPPLTARIDPDKPLQLQTVVDGVPAKLHVVSEGGGPRGGTKGRESAGIKSSPVQPAKKPTNSWTPQKKSSTQQETIPATTNTPTAAKQVQQEGQLSGASSRKKSSTATPGGSTIGGKAPARELLVDEQKAAAVSMSSSAKKNQTPSAPAANASAAAKAPAPPKAKAAGGGPDPGSGAAQDEKPPSPQRLIQAVPLISPATEQLPPSGELQEGQLQTTYPSRTNEPSASTEEAANVRDAVQTYPYPWNEGKDLPPETASPVRGKIHAKVEKRKHQRRLSALRLTQIENYLSYSDLDVAATPSASSVVQQGTRPAPVVPESPVFSEHSGAGTRTSQQSSVAASFHELHGFNNSSMTTSGRSNKLASSQTSTGTNKRQHDLESVLAKRTLLYDDKENVIFEKTSRKTLVHYACMATQERIVQYLVECHSFGIQTVDAMGFAPLHIVVRNGALSLARYLLHARANVNDKTRNEFADTALHMVSSLANPFSITSLLLEYQANCFETNSDHCTPLDVVQRSKNHPARDALLLILQRESERQQHAEKQRQASGAEGGSSSGEEVDITMSERSAEKLLGHDTITRRIWASLAAFIGR